MPDWKAELSERLGTLRIAPEREAEIIDELAQHLEERYDELLLSGSSPEDAERQTRAELSEHEVLARELRGIERRQTPPTFSSTQSPTANPTSLQTSRKTSATRSGFCVRALGLLS